MSSKSLCPLCSGSDTPVFGDVHSRTYYRCGNCALVFVDRGSLLSGEDERARYELHQNNPADLEYRRFLSRLADPLAEVLPPGAKGLDFGCGPGPTLSLIMAERGFQVEDFDPFFSPDTSLLEKQYDFVTCTEVLEHLYYPASEIELLTGLVQPGGWLAVMTEMFTPEREFAEWHYVREPTHVAFYSEETMRWIAERWNLEMHSPHRNVRLFKK